MYVQFENQYGMLSAVYAQNFTLDMTAPVVSAHWLGAATATSGGQATLVIKASDNITALSNLQLSLDGGASWQPFASQVPVTFSQSGWQEVTVLVRD